MDRICRVLEKRSIQVGRHWTKPIRDSNLAEKIRIDLLVQDPGNVGATLPTISVAFDYEASGGDVIHDLPLIGGTIVVVGKRVRFQAEKVANGKWFTVTYDVLQDGVPHQLDWAIPPTIKKKPFTKIYSGPAEQEITIYAPEQKEGEIMIKTSNNPSGFTLQQPSVSVTAKWVSIKAHILPKDAKKLTGKFEL